MTKWWCAFTFILIPNHFDCDACKTNIRQHYSSTCTWRRVHVPAHWPTEQVCWGSDILNTAHSFGVFYFLAPSQWNRDLVVRVFRDFLFVWTVFDEAPMQLQWSVTPNFLWWPSTEVVFDSRGGGEGIVEKNMFYRTRILGKEFELLLSLMSCYIWWNSKILTVLQLHNQDQIQPVSWASSWWSIMHSSYRNRFYTRI